MPKISVIVPVYNAGEYLEGCIGSILNQSFKDFELILVNDGSKDCSLAICKGFERHDSRVVLVDKENEGVAASRNVGICKARGEWVAFVDADDSVDADFLERLIVADDAELVVGGAQYIHKKYRFSPVRQTIDVKGNADIVDAQLCEIYFMTPWAKLFKRRILEENGILFNRNLRIGEDTDFVLRFLNKAKTVTFVESCAYLYNDNAVGYGKYALDTEQYRMHTDTILGSLKVLMDRCGYSFPKTVALLEDYYSRLYWTYIERVVSYAAMRKEASLLKKYNCTVYPDSMKKRVVLSLMRHMTPLAYVCILLNRKREA